MSEVKFTKGEWVIRGREIGTVDKSDTQSYGMLNVIARVEMYDHGEEAGNANAHLMKTSSKMYAMLEEFVADELDGGSLHRANRINKLLAEARGEL